MKKHKLPLSKLAWSIDDSSKICVVSKSWLQTSSLHNIILKWILSTTVQTLLVYIVLFKKLFNVFYILGNVDNVVLYVFAALVFQ